MGRDHSELVSQQRNQWPPHPRGLCVAMNQNNRWTMTGGQIMQLHPTGSCGTRVDHRAIRLCHDLHRSAEKKPKQACTNTEGPMNFHKISSLKNFRFYHSPPLPPAFFIFSTF